MYEAQAEGVIRMFIREGGTYEAGLLTGAQNWSGSDLTGARKKYASTYAAKRDRLCKEMTRQLNLNTPGYFTRVRALLDSRWRTVLVFEDRDGSWVWWEGAFRKGTYHGDNVLMDLVARVEPGSFVKLRR